MLKIKLPSQAPRHIHVTGPTGRVCRWMNRGANRQAWRDHRDRLRELARARQQQPTHEVPVAAEVVTGVPMTAAPCTSPVPMPSPCSSSSSAPASSSYPPAQQQQQQCCGEEGEEEDEDEEARMMMMDEALMLEEALRLAWRT